MIQKEMKLTAAHIKILETVFELNKLNAYPTNEGIKKILYGIVDDESKDYIDILPFSSLISISGRRLCAHILNLYRHGYLANYYDKNDDEMYLQITMRGEDAITVYKSKHHISYQKKNKTNKKTILKL